MKKRKVLMLGGLVASATTLGSIATLISCNKDESQKSWLSIDEKTITINDGRTGTQGNDDIQFIFNSNVDIEAGANIEIDIDGQYSEDNDFNVEFKKIEITETTKQIVANVKLLGKGAKDIDDIYNDSHATFNVKVQWKDEDDKVLKEQVVKDLKIDFYCQDNEISVLNDGVATTLRDEAKARFIFNLGEDDQIPDKNNHELLVDIDAHAGEESLIEDVELDSWEVNEQNQLVVYFNLIHYFELFDQDSITFDIRMRCVDKVTNKVYWDYQNGNVFKIIYSTHNTYFPQSQCTVAGGDNEVETNTHIYTIYYWHGLDYDAGEISFTAEIDPEWEHKNEVQISLSTPTITEYPYVYNVATLTATFTKKSDGSPLEHDYDIPFRIKFEIKGHHEITEDEDSGLCTFCYRSKKFNDITEQLTQKTAFDIGESSFNLTLLVEPEDGYSFKYNVITNEETYIPYAADTDCDVDGATLSSLVGIKAKEGEKLVNGNTGNFALQIVGVDANGVEQWKQTTGSLLNIQYRSSIDDYISSYEINNGVLTGEISFTLGDETSTNLTAGDPVYVGEPEHFDGIEFGTITTVGKNGKIPYTLDPKIDLKFDGFIKFNFNVSGQASDGTPWTYTFENVSITYATGAIIEEKEQWTEAGKPYAFYDVEFKPDWKPSSLTDITINAETSSTDFNVSLFQLATTYDASKGILHCAILISPKDGAHLPRNASANFSLTVVTDKIPELTFSNLSLNYLSAIYSHDTIVTTEPGVHEATYELEFRNEISDDSDFDIQFNQQPEKLLNEIEVTPDPDNKKIVYVKVTADETIQPDEDIHFKLNVSVTDKTSETTVNELTDEMTFIYASEIECPVKEKNAGMEERIWSKTVNFEFQLINHTFVEGDTITVEQKTTSSSKDKLSATRHGNVHITTGTKNVSVPYHLSAPDGNLALGDWAIFRVTFTFTGTDGNTWVQTIKDLKLTCA
ncbi:MAG: hypothetical protein ACOQNV_03215 [Mycoplasmoidaceae bacterium]